MSGAVRIVLRGEARVPGGTAAPATVTLSGAGLGVAVGGSAPWEAAYRDVATVAVDAGAVLVQLGTGPGAERWLFERFGSGLAALARGLRDGRLRQWLEDGLVELGEDPVELVEFAFAAAGSSTGEGVGQLVYHRRGAALAPLDERLPRLRVRRADIGAVEPDPLTGRLRISGAGGSLATGRPTDGDASATPTRIDALEFRGLGQATTSHARRWSALRDGAAADIAAILAGFIPDAPFAARRAAGSSLREGRPAGTADLGDAWAELERAVLVEPTFAASYGELVAKAGGSGAPRWLAIAPESPGRPDAPRAWFLVGLPGNLLALELVTGGSHATYLFRVAPRATFAGPSDPAALAEAVRDVSEALVDSRFLREPMALPADRLADARFLRYRLALAALPSLAVARTRFVARLVHRDAESWGAALDDLVRWHGSARDEAEEWPGRAAQERFVDDASNGDPASSPS